MARQAVHAAGERRQADARLRQAEAGVVGGDDQVARQSDLEAAAQREAIDRGDHRLEEIEARGDAAEAALRRRSLRPCRAGRCT